MKGRPQRSDKQLTSDNVCGTVYKIIVATRSFSQVFGTKFAVFPSRSGHQCYHFIDSGLA